MGALGVLELLGTTDPAEGMAVLHAGAAGAPALRAFPPPPDEHSSDDPDDADSECRSHGGECIPMPSTDPVT